MYEMYVGNRTDDLYAAALLAGILKRTGRDFSVCFMDDRWTAMEKRKIFADEHRGHKIITVGLSFNTEEINPHLQPNRFEDVAKAFSLDFPTIWDNHKRTSASFSNGNTNFACADSGRSISRFAFLYMQSHYKDNPEVMSFLIRASESVELLHKYSSLRNTDFDLTMLKKINCLVNIPAGREELFNVFVDEPEKFVSLLDSEEVTEYLKKQDKRLETFKKSVAYSSDSLIVFAPRKSSTIVQDMDNFIAYYFLKTEFECAYVINGDTVFIRTRFRDSVRRHFKLFYNLKTAGIAVRMREETKTRAEVKIDSKQHRTPHFAKTVVECIAKER